MLNKMLHALGKAMYAALRWAFSAYGDAAPEKQKPYGRHWTPAHNKLSQKKKRERAKWQD